MEAGKDKSALNEEVEGGDMYNWRSEEGVEVLGRLWRKKEGGKEKGEERKEKRGKVNNKDKGEGEDWALRVERQGERGKGSGESRSGKRQEKKKIGGQ
jgi:hypothetical protein